MNLFVLFSFISHKPNLLGNPERNVHMGVVSLTVKSIKWNYLSHICCSLGDQQTSTTEPAVSIKILWARFLNTLPSPNAWSKLVKGKLIGSWHEMQDKGIKSCELGGEVQCWRICCKEWDTFLFFAPSSRLSLLFPPSLQQNTASKTGMLHAVS